MYVQLIELKDVLLLSCRSFLIFDLWKERWRNEMVYLENLTSTRNWNISATPRKWLKIAYDYYMNGGWIWSIKYLETQKYKDTYVLKKQRIVTIKTAIGNSDKQKPKNCTKVWQENANCLVVLNRKTAQKLKEKSPTTTKSHEK